MSLETRSYSTVVVSLGMRSQPSVCTSSGWRSSTGRKPAFTEATTARRRDEKHVEASVGFSVRRLDPRASELDALVGKVFCRA
jgi:hypothetical protein